MAQVGHSLVLSFTPPTLATDGERLTKPVEVEIFRAVAVPGVTNLSSSWAYDTWITLLPENLQPREPDGRVRHVVKLTANEFTKWRGSTWTLALRPLTRNYRGRAIVGPASKPVVVPILDVPEPLQEVRARTTEQAIELSWCAPAQPGSAYRVYRSTTGKAGSFVPLAETIGPAYSDRGFEFGPTYFYKVVAILKQGPTVAASEDSPIIAITPRDTFPPAAPRGLTAVFTANAVELIWDANAEPDLSGYNVYRRAQGVPESKINPEPLRTPIFRDTSIAAGTMYVYRVTALDMAGNESPPSKEVPAETR